MWAWHNMINISWKDYNTNEYNCIKTGKRAKNKLLFIILSVMLHSFFMHVLCILAEYMHEEIMKHKQADTIC